MNSIWSVETIFITVLGYPISYLEFFGTLLNLWSVWLATRNRTLTWPVGIAGVILFAILFYQIQLYSDLIEQVYYVITGFWGWWAWSRPVHTTRARGTLPISTNSAAINALYGVGILICTLALGGLMERIHVLLPDYFPQAASFAFLDAFTTVVSFAATILMIRRKIECWALWITVDVIGIGLYFVKGVPLIAILYLMFLILAVNGFLTWRSMARIEALA